MDHRTRSLQAHSECMDFGNHRTEDAEDDMHGLAKFFRNEDDPTFVLGG